MSRNLSRTLLNRSIMTWLQRGLLVTVFALFEHSYAVRNGSFQHGFGLIYDQVFLQMCLSDLLPKLEQMTGFSRGRMPHARPILSFVTVFPYSVFPPSCRTFALNPLSLQADQTSSLYHFRGHFSSGLFFVSELLMLMLSPTIEESFRWNMTVNI